MLVFLLGVTLAFGQNYEVQSRLANGNFYGNEMSLHLRIYNNSEQPLNLTDKKLTYYFTDSSPLTKFLYNIWWYSKGQQNDAVVDFYQTNELDKYFTVSFTSGSVEPSGYAEIQMRVHKSDWSYFNQIDDISVSSGNDWSVNSNINFSLATVEHQEPPIIPFPPAPLNPQENTENPLISSFAYRDILQNTSDFAVFGSEGVYLTDRTGAYLSGVEIYGSVGTNKKIEFGADSKIHGNSYAGASAFLRERASLYGDFRTGESYTSQNNVYISGGIATSSPAPLLNLQTKNISVGTNDIFISPDEERTLVPGTYHNLASHSRSKLKLSSGVYIFNDFKLEPESTLEIDVSGGKVEILVANTVIFSDRVKLKWTNDFVNPIMFQVYQNGNSDLILGRDIVFAGNFLAPNAKIRVSSGVKFAGWLQGKSIQIEPDTKICEPPTLESFSHSGVAFAPYFNSLQAEYHSVMLPSEPQISVYTKSKEANVFTSIVETSNETVQNFKIKLYSAEKENIMQWCTENTYSFAVSRRSDAIIYAKENSACERDCNGSSWAKAYKDLAKAMSAGKEQGKSIYLAEGNYKTADGKPFILKAGTDIRGGFEGVGGETLETRRGDINAVVLSGENKVTRVLEFLGGGGVPFSQKLDRATVTKGGIGIFAVGSSPVLDYIIVRNNDNADNFGGGVLSALTDTLKILNSYIIENSARLGGGIFATENSKLSLINTIVANNTAENGSATYANNGYFGIRHTTIANNNESDGKGIFLGSATANGVNNIVWNNGESDISQGENPLFKSDIPAGEDGLFFTKDDGYALSDSSQMIDKGIVQEDIPTDIFMVERTVSKDGSNLPDMGAREWFLDIKKNIVLLKKTADRKWVISNTTTILSESVGEYFPLKRRNSPYTYNLSVKLPKNKHMKDKHSTKVRVFNENGNVCGESKNFKFYRIAEENGIVEYRTRRDREGQYLFLAEKEMPSYKWYQVLKVCKNERFRIQVEVLE
ncbi:hypothetical protein AGMMS49938_12730 [Fibrobacterales bacterium]|nr:hypothetical protein AGMMS49938_12730 [Fibrobacterales bacterium]